MDGHNDNDICVCRMCIKSMKMMIPQDVRSNLGGGEASRPHVISLTCHGVLTDYNTPHHTSTCEHQVPEFTTKARVECLSPLHPKGD